MQHCSGGFGVDVGNFHLTDINYADDAVFFTDDPTKWDYVFRNFAKIQNIGTGDAPRTVHIDNQAVETVSRFTYLGSDIDSDGYSYPEIPYTDAWASLASLWLNLTTSGVSKDLVSPPSSDLSCAVGSVIWL